MGSDKSHWENVYNNKSPAELSWTQASPATSLDLVHSLGLSRTARIIDIGGGDSRLVDCLLDEGYTDITVLDISGTALLKAQKRVGPRAHLVKWIEQDITQFHPTTKYDLWHDRATFHFLTRSTEVSQYLSIAKDALPYGGYFVIGTFSDNGPEICSGLPIHQYSEQDLTQALADGFSKIKCFTEDHLTPFNTLQNFLFCSFKRA